MDKLASSISTVSPDKLASLLDEDSSQRIWSEAELGAILKHQMAIPIAVDLSGQKKAAAQQLIAVCAGQGMLLKSYEDLFEHEHPPFELLKIIKDYAKTCLSAKNSPLPSEVASVLYYATIAAAMVRCRRRISTLTDDKLRKGFKWVLTRPWKDKAISKLVKQAMSSLA
jgi:hypothetical protein